MNRIWLLILALAIVVAFLYYLILVDKIPNPLAKKPLSLGEQIYTKTQNPLEDKIPETNPFTKVNPFKDVYKNPFD